MQKKEEHEITSCFIGHSAWRRRALFHTNKLGYRFVSNYQLNAHFLYSVTIYSAIQKDELNFVNIDVRNCVHLFESPCICYIIILDMFRAVLCSSSGGQILLLQNLVSSLSVNGRTVCRLRADCSPLSTGLMYGHLQRVMLPDAAVIQFILLKMSIVLLETCRGL
jgi:hypothetical protein